jgi:sirohydrochlorin ferrochelatase
MKGVLVIAHGSRARESESSLDEVLAMVREKMPGVLIECSFMEFSDRTFAKGVKSLIDKGVDEIRIVPFFLFMGVHMKEDIPALAHECAKEYESVAITMAEPLGADMRLADILVDRIRA